MKTSNWNGTDANLEISLNEYGLLISEHGKNIHVIYGNNDTFYQTFTTRSELNSIINESWFNLNSFLSFVGLTLKQWKASYIACRIFDLIQYYGYENIFGTPSNSYSKEEIKELTGI